MIIQSEEKIMDLFAFKKDLQIKSEEDADFEKTLEELTGKTVIIEYNNPEGDV